MELNCRLKAKLEKKGNNSILTYMRRILNLQFKSRLFLSLPFWGRFGGGFKNIAV